MRRAWNLGLLIVLWTFIPDASRGAVPASSATERPEPALRLVSPAAEVVTGEDAYPVELAVAATPPSLMRIILLREKAKGIERWEKSFDVHDIIDCRVPLSPGRNVFTAFLMDQKGRRREKVSFHIVRMTVSGASPLPASAYPASAAPAPPPSAPAAVPVPPPAVPPAPAPPPAAPTPPPVPVREYGPGRCGYPMSQRMSIPVTENGVTRYVEFQTDENGCLPAAVELK